MLDDNRLYRQTAPPPPRPPPTAPKKNSKKAKAASRASKRRKLSEAVVSDEEDTTEQKAEDTEAVAAEDDGLGGMKWECLAVTLDDLTQFLASLKKSRDGDEKVLRKRLEEGLLPILEKQEENRKRKAAQKEKELLNLEKLASAKRSSRIAGKLEHQRQEEEIREAERKRQAELAMAKKEQEKWMKLERERESRMMTREQRVREREARRILHEEELAGLSEDSKKLETGESRLSERHLKAEIERKKQALEELAEEDDWVFDCICGAYGQVDDGTHSISCEKCNIWQHTKCVGISEAAANRDDFHFICSTCKRRAEESEKAKHRPSIKLKLNRPDLSSSPAPVPQSNGILPKDSTQISNAAQTPGMSPQKVNINQYTSPPRPNYESPYTLAGPQPLKLRSPESHHSNPSSTPVSKDVDRPSSHGVANSTKLSPHMNGFGSSYSNFQPSPRLNGEHAFTPPRPYSPTSLPPPPQPQNYAFVNGQSTPNLPRTADTTAFWQSNGQTTTQPYTGPSPHDETPNRYGGNPLTPIQSSHLTGNTQNGQSQHNAGPLGEVEDVKQQSNTNQFHRRASVTMPSPLGISAVVSNLLPGTDVSPANTTLQRQSGADVKQPAIPLLAQSLSTPGFDPSQSFTNNDQIHTLALPAASTGISPIKHSPPRPTAANGTPNIGSITPSVLPPVTFLSPIPQQPNLTPPVKPTEPERSTLAGQTGGT